MIRKLMYIELKTGYSDNGPAWIGYVMTLKTGRTVYFNNSNRQALLEELLSALFIKIL